MKKLVFVTGAGRGIGRDTALALVEAGFMVAGCARTSSQLDETRRLSKDQIITSVADVTSHEQMENWILETCKNTQAQPWGLVTAAGIHGPIGSFIENDWDHWKQTVDINLYGTILASKFFAKALIEQGTPGRIVHLSGGGATKPLSHFTAYCATKSAVVRFGETIAVELKKHQITVNSIAPGAIFTDFTKEVLKAGPEKAGPEMYASALKQQEGAGTTTERATGLIKYLMSEPAGTITGRLLAAVWDDWSDLHTNFSRFEKTDVFTLRRIIPEDRDL